jgi:hypothetical protein
MGPYQSLNPAQVSGVEAQVSGQGDGVQPELGRHFVSVDVHVRRLVSQIVAVEVEPVRSNTQHGRHSGYLTGDASALSI